MRPFGRTMSVGRTSRSSRRNLGSNPARRNDDFPAPDGPSITSSVFTPEVRMPRNASSPRRIWASRPKNTAASTSSRASHPRYGARSGSLGGGQRKTPPRSPCTEIVAAPGGGPSVRNMTGSAPSPTSTSVVGPSPQQVAFAATPGRVRAGQRASRAPKIRLVQVLREPELGLALRRGLPVRRQQADHRLTAGARLPQRLLPPLPRPNPDVSMRVEEDFVGQRRILLNQPLPQRN